MAKVNSFVALAALFIVLSASAVSAAPSISSYDISSSSISVSQPITVTGSAEAQGGCIVKHRFFIVGSQGGVWTNTSCVQSVSLNDVIPTDSNPRSFYRNPGAYVARWEIVDSSGQVATKDLIVRVGTPDSGVAPSIDSFTAPSSVVQGDRLIVSGHATAASSCIIANRFYVVGSQGGVWTANDCAQSVTLNGNEPTLTNPRSFYHGTGSYTFRWEVLGADGFISSTETSFTLDEEPSSDGGSPTPTDTVPPASASNLVLVSVNSTSASWSWTNPSSDFGSAIIYLNNVNVQNTSASSFTISGLSPSTFYNMTIYTVDASGNMNRTGVSSFVTTLAQSGSGSSSNDSGSSSSSRNRNHGVRYIASDDDSESEGVTSVITSRSGNEPTVLTSGDERESSNILSMSNQEAALVAMLVSCVVLFALAISVFAARRRKK